MGKDSPSSLLCKEMGAGFFPTAPKVDVPGDYGGFAAQMSPQHSLGHSHPPPSSTKQPFGQLQQPTPAPRVESDGAQMGAVKTQGKPQSPLAHPMDSLLAAVAVPSNVASSDPKLFLTGKHTGTGLNPDVTPKGLRYKVWWDAGQPQTQGSLQPEDPSPAPAAVPPPSTPSLHRPLYTARGGNVAKSSPRMKRKWQPKGPFRGPPRCLSQSEGCL